MARNISTSLDDMVKRGNLIVAVGYVTQKVWAKWTGPKRISGKVYVTFNGSYTQGWRLEADGWTVRWVMSNSEFGDCYSRTGAQIIDRCEEFLEKIKAGLPVEV